MYSKRIFIGAVLCVGSFFAVGVLMYVRAEISLPVIERVPEIQNPSPMAIGLPIHVFIPTLDIDAPIVSVGFTDDGAMDTPSSAGDVAWFNLGPRPGNVGGAVLAGHFGWYNNAPAVFDRLHEIQIGDTMMIQNDTGAMIRFVVRETRIYDKDDDATEIFHSNDGKAHLNLITCTGAWNAAEQTRADRLVVFADMEY